MRGRHKQLLRVAIAIAAVAVSPLALLVLEGANASAAGTGRPRLPKISSVTVSDINDRGQVVGSLTKSYDDATRGFVWRKGALRLLGRGRFAGAREINDSGQIIGTSGDHEVLWKYGHAEWLWPLTSVWALNEAGQVLGGNDIHGDSAPFLWTDGDRSPFRPLPFAPGLPTAMNNLGQVVGQMPDGRAAEWQDGELTDLGPGIPIAINDRGEIIGNLAGDGDHPVHAIVWQNGTPIDLGPGVSVALNERGQVIGMLPPFTVGESHAFLWSDGTMTDLGTLGGRSARPTAISDSGQVVGYSTDRRGVQHGFVWQHGTMTRLPTPPGHAGSQTRALAINNHNQIVGDNCWACFDRGGDPSRFAVLWTLRGHKIETRRLVDIRR